MGRQNHVREPSRRRAGVSAFAERISTILEEAPGTADGHTPDQLANWRDQSRCVEQAGQRLADQLTSQVPRDGIHFAASYLGMLDEGNIALSSPDQLAVLMEFAVYNFRPGGLNVIEQVLAGESPVSDELQRRWLLAARRAHYALVLTTKTYDGFGVLGRDILRGQDVLVADTEVGRSASTGLTFASRLIPVGDFCITAGAWLPITDLAALTRIGDYLERTFGRTEVLQQLPRQQALLLESFIINSCLMQSAN